MNNRRQSAITGGAEARFTDRLLAKQPSGSQQGQGRQCNLRWNSFPKANRTLNRKGQEKCRGLKMLIACTDVTENKTSPLRHPV